MNQNPLPRIDEAISAAESAGARVGVCAAGPNGFQFTYRENEIFKSASCIKIAIMIEIFRRIDAGGFSLDQKYTLSDEDRTGGSGVLQQLHAGIELTLRDLCFLMISISDNPATNILTELVGMDAVNATMKSLGLQESILGRPMRGRPAFENEQENLATPAEFAQLVSTILDGTAASAESCMKMMEMMELQSNDKRIGRFVPEGSVWGSKTGSYTTVVNDCGYVQTADGPLVISVFIEDTADVVTGEGIIAEITKELLAAVD